MVKDFQSDRKINVTRGGWELDGRGEERKPPKLDMKKSNEME